MNTIVFAEPKNYIVKGEEGKRICRDGEIPIQSSVLILSIFSRSYPLVLFIVKSLRFLFTSAG
jgi:hypothetical protein